MKFTMIEALSQRKAIVPITPSRRSGIPVMLPHLLMTNIFSDGYSNRGVVLVATYMHASNAAEQLCLLSCLEIMHNFHVVSGGHIFHITSLSFVQYQGLLSGTLYLQGPVSILYHNTTLFQFNVVSNSEIWRTCSRIIITFVLQDSTLTFSFLIGWSHRYIGFSLDRLSDMVHINQFRNL